MEMSPEARAYVDAVPPGRRPLLDRLQRLLLEVHPDAAMVLAYRMPTYVVGDRRLHVGVWKHGLSLYGWRAGEDAGFADRHPELVGERGTLRLPTAAMTSIEDEELRALLRACLG